MFEFLKNLFSSNNIKRLEGQLQGRPTPQLYLQLADAYKETGNTTKAAQILKLGATRFPSSPEVVRRQAEAEKDERRNEIKRLQDKIQSHPNPILYARLAELYKADNELDKTIQICQAGIKAFPKYGGTYLVLGQVYADRQQWPEATTQLEKCVELDKYNYMALKLLAQVYMQIGRPADAAKRLEDILYFAPGDEAITELLKKSKEASGDAPKHTPDTVSIASPRSPAKTGVMPKVVQSMRDKQLTDGLNSVRSIDGVQGALLVDQFGLVVAASLDASVDEGLAGALITNVYRTSSSNAVKLGVGEFEEGVIECESGNVHLAQVNDMILAVFASHSTKVGLLEKSIREFAASLLQKH